MLNWWNEMSITQQIYAIIAVPATLILIIQTILVIIGIGNSDADTDSALDMADGADDLFDSGDDGLALFSVRGIMAMLAITGWSGVALLETNLHIGICIAISIALGFGALVGVAYLMQLVSKLQSSGNINIVNAIGKVAQVYIPIPPKGTGTGKVNLTIQEKYTECVAITESETALPTGSYVRVISVDEAGTLMVEPVVK